MVDAKQLPVWMQRALDAYENDPNGPRVRQLQHTFVTLVRLLTGVNLKDSDVQVHLADRLMTLPLDGEVFALRTDGTSNLMLLRPCKECQAGALSPQFVNQPRELGEVLAHWDQLCEQCREKKRPTGIGFKAR